MAHYLVLLEDGLVVLGIFRGAVAVGATASFFDKVFRSLEVFPVARDFIQLAKGHLDDGMAAGTVNLSFGRSERLAYQVGILDGHVEEIALPRSTVMGDGAFYQMAGVVQFV